MASCGETMENHLYVFIDEAGNFDFSPGGTKYFILTAASKERPFCAYQEMTELKYDLVESGKNIEYFHASEDAQAIRNKVFAIIQRNLAGVRLDSLIVEKRKIGPASDRERVRFLPERNETILLMNRRFQEKKTTPATLTREPHGLLSPGWNLFN